MLKDRCRTGHLVYFTQKGDHLKLGAQADDVQELPLSLIRVLLGERAKPDYDVKLINGGQLARPSKSRTLHTWTMLADKQSTRIDRS